MAYSGAVNDTDTDTDTPSRTRLGRRLLSMVERRLIARRGASGEQTPSEIAVDRASTAFVQRAHGVMDRLDGVAATLERVAAVELKVVERLVPIVDDLGELVRLTLNEARERQGLSPKRVGRVEPSATVIDVTPEQRKPNEPAK